MKTTITLCLTASLLGWAAATSADVLELKNGQVLTPESTSAAPLAPFDSRPPPACKSSITSQALALTFSGGAASAPVAAPTAAPAAPATPAPAAAAPASVTVNAGTTLLGARRDRYPGR